jgi:hypothetical protein
MFDLFVSGVQAYNQVGFFIGAAICLGIGGFILGYSLYWRLHAVRATGTIIGVTAKDNLYTPVYRYTLPNGETHEAKSDTGSGWLKGKETGRVVPLLVSAHNPTEARTKNNYSLELISVLFIIPGLWLGHTALTIYPVTWMTWVMAGALLLYFVERVHRIFIPKGERLSIAEWRKQHNLDGSASIDLKEVKPVEQLFAPGKRPPWISNRQWAPLVGLFALLLAGIGVFQSYKMSRLEASGLRAPGAVVSLKEEESGNDSSYYPVVRYQTDKNLSVEFKDSIGSNPPSYRTGDKVTVLYLANEPQRAVIDRGVWNWVIPGLLLLGAGFVSWLTVSMLRSGSKPKPA